MCMSGGGGNATRFNASALAKTPADRAAANEAAIHGRRALHGMTTEQRKNFMENAWFTSSGAPVQGITTDPKTGVQRGFVWERAAGGRDSGPSRMRWITRQGPPPKPKVPDKPKTPVKPIVKDVVRGRDRVTTDPNGPDPRKPTRLFPDRVRDLVGNDTKGIATFGERYFRRRKNSVVGDKVDPIARFGTDADYVGASGDLLGSA